MSVAAVAQLVGVKSRNSVFRILAGETSNEINLRFLETLHEVIGDQWPVQRWFALEEALSIERLGIERYRANCAFQRVLHEREAMIPAYSVRTITPDGRETTQPMATMLKEIASSARAEIVITGCCDSGLSLLLVQVCNEAGARGTLSVRQYIDTTEETVVRNILGILPLVTRPWYNARLVAPGSCPEEMMAVYRLHALHIHRWDDQGRQYGEMCIRYDDQNYVSRGQMEGANVAITVLDRWRFHLELLKEMPSINGGKQAFVDYTQHYLGLEENNVILSIKPDVHFNCIPTAVLEQAVSEGFRSLGMMQDAELTSMLDILRQVHGRRFDNILHKRRMTHLVYSLPMMEKFMRTGMASDHFFLQRPYTVEERRQVIRALLDAMRQEPYFNIHFLKEGAPIIHYEISLYGDRGVMLTDAYTGYDLETEHSEALITLPAFREAFRQYFQDELLPHYVLSRAETIQHLERLLVMNTQ